MIKKYLVCDRCKSETVIDSDYGPTIHFDMRGYKNRRDSEMLTFCEECYNIILAFSKSNNWNDFIETKFSSSFWHDKNKLKTDEEWGDSVFDVGHPNMLVKMERDLLKSNRTFSEALIYLKQGYFIRRKGWDIFLKIDTKNVILVSDSQGYLTWNSYQSDIMADDWEIFKK